MKQKYQNRIYSTNVNIKYSITEVKKITYYKWQHNLITTPNLLHINTGTLFHNSHHFSFWLFCVRWPAVPLLSLFKYALSWGASVLVQCTTVNVTVLITIFKECAGNVFHMSHVINTLKFSQLNKSTESEQQQLH